jgi:hypothetical protein
MAEVAVRHTVGARAAVAAALPTRAQVVLGPRVEAPRRREQELPPRPTDCRTTGKTCWWAGSRRRTAYTRSCEKLPSSSCAALKYAAGRAEHTRFAGFADISSVSRTRRFAGASWARTTPEPRRSEFFARSKAEQRQPESLGQLAEVRQISGLFRLECGRLCPTGHASSRAGRAARHRARRPRAARCAANSARTCARRRC